MRFLSLSGWSNGAREWHGSGTATDARLFFSLLPAEIPVCELVCSVFFMPFEAAGHMEVMDLDLFKPGLVSFTSSI